MNNYCTNCGKKLDKNDLVCKFCNTPIIDLPNNHNCNLFENKQKNSLIIIVCAFLIFLIRLAMINKMKKEYVEPYLKENYNDSAYSIKYKSSGKCVISGNCYFDPAMGCDGGSCQEYEYLNGSNCKSYYYSVKSDLEEFTITVVRKNNKLYVVEGKNIYGEDKINHKYSNNINSNDESNYINTYKDDNKKVIIDKYPYESDYYKFKYPYEDNKIYLDNEGMIMNFFTGILNDNSKFHITGFVTNPKYLKGIIDMATKYYDKNYNEIGTCIDKINLLGERYPSQSFSCHISDEDLTKGNKFEDIVYYKINITSIDIRE